MADLDTLRMLAGKLADGIVATPMIHHDNFTRDIPATVKLMAEGAAGILALLDENERLRKALKAWRHAHQNTTYPDDHPVWEAEKLARAALDGHP